MRHWELCHRAPLLEAADAFAESRAIGVSALAIASARRVALERPVTVVGSVPLCWPPNSERVTGCHRSLVPAESDADLRELHTAPIVESTDHAI